MEKFLSSLPVWATGILALLVFVLVLGWAMLSFAVVGIGRRIVKMTTAHKEA